MEILYENLFNIILVSLAILVFLGFIRVLRGPKIADRIVAINMIGTIIITIIAVLAVILEESYLVDISLIYALISFLAVVVLSKVYMGAHEEAKKRREKRRQNNNDGMD